MEPHNHAVMLPYFNTFVHTYSSTVARQIVLAHNSFVVVVFHQRVTRREHASLVIAFLYFMSIFLVLLDNRSFTIGCNEESCSVLCTMLCAMYTLNMKKNHI